MAAGFGHLFDSFPGLPLGFVADAVFDQFPFAEKFAHLEVVENGLAEGIDAAEQGERSLAVGGNDGVKNDPFASFAEVIFEFDYQGHTGRNVTALGEFGQVGRGIEGNRADQRRGVIGCGLSGMAEAAVAGIEFFGVVALAKLNHQEHEVARRDRTEKETGPLREPLPSFPFRCLGQRCGG